MYWNGKGQKRMDKLLKLIKDAMREGADFAAIETLVKDLDVLAGIKTVDDAKEFIKKNDLFNKANDSNVSIAVKSHDDKFTAEKLPGLLKAEGEKVRKEINPDETPEQIKIREQGEQILTLQANESKSTLKTSLSNKAKELGYDGNVDLFLGFGDKAEGMLKAEFKRFKTSVDERVSSDIKKLYGDTKPKTSAVDPAKSMKRADYEAMNPNEQANVNFSEITLVD